MSRELRQLRQLLADECATSDIESYCHCVARNRAPRGWWYDTSNISGLGVSPDRKFIDRALRYLELRGLLIRRRGKPHVVSFRPITTTAPRGIPW